MPHRVSANNQVFLDIHLHWPSQACAHAALKLAGIGSAAPIAIKLNKIQVGGWGGGVEWMGGMDGGGGGGGGA